MDGPRDYILSDVSQTKTDTIYHSYVELNLKNDTNELVYKIETKSQM